MFLFIKFPQVLTIFEVFIFFSVHVYILVLRMMVAILKILKQDCFQGKTKSMNSENPMSLSFTVLEE